MNIVMLTGNLSSDVEVRYTQSGKAVATFSMATNEKRGEEQRADFHRIVAWEKLAEGCGQYKKGQPVTVIGKLHTRSYEDNNGQKKYVTEVTANSVALSAYTNVSEGGKSNFDNFGSSEEVPF